MKFFNSLIAMSALAVSINALPVSVSKDEDTTIADMAISDLAGRQVPPPTALTPAPQPEDENEMDEWEDEALDTDEDEDEDDDEVDAQGKKKKKKGKKGKKGKKPLAEKPEEAAALAPVPAAGTPAPGAAPNEAALAPKPAAPKAVASTA